MIGQEKLKLSSASGYTSSILNPHQKKKRQPAALQPALRASSESSAARSASSQNAFNGFGRARERTILQSSGKLWRQILGATPNTVRDLRPWSGQGPNTDWAEV